MQESDKEIGAHFETLLLVKRSVRYTAARDAEIHGRMKTHHGRIQNLLDLRQRIPLAHLDPLHRRPLLHNHLDITELYSSHLA